MTAPFSLYFDELGGGESFETAGRTVTESDLVSFSALTGDWHPQHADADWAAAGPFGERVAHGMLVLSYSLGLAPIDPERIVALRGLDSVRFKRPVRIGETIRVRGEVARLRPLDDGTGLVTIDWKVLGAEGRTALRAELQAIWRRRPQDEAATGGSEGEAVAGEEECGGPHREEVAVGRGTAHCAGGAAGEPAAYAGREADDHCLYEQQPGERDGDGEGLVGHQRADADANHSGDGGRGDSAEQNDHDVGAVRGDVDVPASQPRQSDGERQQRRDNGNCDADEARGGELGGHHSLTLGRDQERRGNGVEPELARHDHDPDQEDEHATGRRGGDHVAKPFDAVEAGAVGSADLGDGERDAERDEGERGYDAPPERSGSAELQ